MMRTRKKNSSKLLAVLLSFMMIFTMMPTVAFAAEEAYLSDVAFRNKMTNGDEYTLLPAFDKDTYNYTLVVDDYANPANGLYIFPTSSDGSKISVSRTHVLNGRIVTAKVTSGGKTSLMQSFKANSGQGGNVITATVGTKAYTFNLVRKMSLKALALSDVTGETPYEISFDKTNTSYFVSVPADLEKIKIEATPTASDSLVTISGGSEAIVDVKLVDHTMTIPVVVSNAATEGNVATTYNLILQEQPSSFAVTTAPAKTVYRMGESFDPEGMVVSAVYTDGSAANVLDPSEYVITSSSVLTDKDTFVTITYAGMDVKLPITVESPFAGRGTETEPYQLTDAEDLVALQSLVKKGITFAGYYFEMTEDITLPVDWVGLGTLKEGATAGAEGENILPFSGSIDGKNHTLTVPKDGMPLFSYVREAEVKNLDIYGEKIASHGLVSNYIVDYGPDGDYGEGDDGGSYLNGTPDTITIENVTLKSGSSTLKSGFLGGFASGANVVNIINCTIEEGVVIGYNRDQSEIGSFAGQFNGRITNSVSYADVYGVNNVGGFIGTKGQSMGPCDVSNSAFHGTVMAIGEYAGGLIGSGYYGGGSAPNTPCVTIQNSLVTGKVTGSDYVGGILGGEPGCESCWDNGIGYIQDNIFVGVVDGMGDNTGGIIGYMNSLNRYNVIENNYFVDGCGAEKGIGAVNEAFVDLTSGNFGRDDDPLGADADKLVKGLGADAFADGTVQKLLNNSVTSLHNWIQGERYPVHSTEPIAYELEVSGEYKTEYLIGEALDLTGMNLHATWSDGRTTEIALEDVVITGYNKYFHGEQAVTLAYGAATAQVIVKTLKPEGTMIDVSLSVLGDDIHSNGAGVHTLEAGNLQVWIEEKSYTVDANATLWDVLQIALRENHITWETANYADTIYVKSLTKDGKTLAESINGENASWMFTINGYHTDLSVAQQYLENGDELVFHYTDDYELENMEKADTPEVGVVNLIENLGEISLASEAAIEDARAAYEALNRAQKERVYNYQTLVEAEQNLADLKAEEESSKPDEPAEPDEPVVPDQPVVLDEPAVPDEPADAETPEADTPSEDEPTVPEKPADEDASAAGNQDEDRDSTEGTVDTDEIEEESPATGDEANLFAYLASLMLAVMTAFGLRRKKN